jgi:hypothetical protein
MDPRVKSSEADLEQQFLLSQRLADLMHQDVQAIKQLRTVKESDQQRATLEKLNSNLTRVFAVIQGSDNKPTIESITALKTLEANLKQQLPK